MRIYTVHKGKTLRIGKLNITVTKQNFGLSFENNLGYYRLNLGYLFFMWNFDYKRVKRTLMTKYRSETPLQ